MAKPQSGNMSFLQHLEILRWHLVRSAIAILLFAILGFIFKSFLFDVVIFGPRRVDFLTYELFCKFSHWANLPELFCMDKMPFKILNTKMAGQFNIHVWVSLIAGVILAFPYILFEIWRFVKPGLNESEIKSSRGIIVFASFLFLLGVLFGYYLIAPLSVQFLGSYQVSAEITNFIDLNSFISTIATVTLASGVIFELPIIVIFLARAGLITPESMKKYRRHAIVMVLILSAIITPPDIMSQILVTIPLILLYEMSIKIAARVISQREKSLTKTAA